MCSELAEFELNVITIPFLQMKKWRYEIAEYAKLINNDVLDSEFLKDGDFYHTYRTRLLWSLTLGRH